MADLWAKMVLRKRAGALRYLPNFRNSMIEPTIHIANIATPKMNMIESEIMAFHFFGLLSA